MSKAEKIRKLQQENERLMHELKKKDELIENLKHKQKPNIGHFIKGAK